ncbi:MAG: hypothetical protein ACSLFE_03740 [Gemmatimonadaceae bacterium]
MHALPLEGQLKPKFRSRGEYRPFYTSIIDDPEFTSMSPAAFKAFFTLRMMLGAAGIGIVRPAVVLETLAWPPAALEAAMQELERPKPGREYGWIVREGRLVWIVNALHFDPTLNEKNGKHRTYVQTLLGKIGDVPLRDRFAAYYPEWLSDPADRKGIKEVSEGYPIHETKRTETNPDNPLTTARARESVPEEFRSDLDQLLDRVPNRESWAAEIASSTNGANKGRGPVPTAVQLGQAIRDFNANAAEPKLTLFRSYIRRATAEPSGGSVRTQRRTTGGPRRDTYEPSEALEWRK